jgi:proline iminopeptidase
MRERPTLLLHGGPGFDHASFKPGFSRLADIGRLERFAACGHGVYRDQPSRALAASQKGSSRSR